MSNKKINNDTNGSLWNTLTEAEKEELLVAYNESFDGANLLSHRQVKLSHSKWLNPKGDFSNNANETL
ncbi:MAG: hypothetical protein ACXVAY_05225 [Mucilaginibacter sp.]